ncbi:MAG: peptidyl-prolyl cis-trans isomerase [Desulfobacteraceae bacterium]
MIVFSKRFLCLLTATPIFFLACGIFDRPEERIVITVGSRDITFQKLRREIKRMSYEMEITGQAAHQVLEPLVNKIIDHYLILEYGKERGIHVSKVELKSALDDIQKEYSKEDFQEMLLQGYIDFEAWKEALRERLLIKKIIQKVSEEVTPVSSQEIKAYYDSHHDEFRSPEMVKFRQMVTKTREEAEGVLKRLAAGGDMTELSMKYSKKPGMENVGELSWIARGDLEESMEKAIFSLEVGEISDVVETPYGFHIFQVVEKRPEGFKALPEALAEVESKLSRQRKEEFYREWLKSLRDLIPVKVDHELLNTLELG